MTRPEPIKYRTGSFCSGGDRVEIGILQGADVAVRRAEGQLQGVGGFRGDAPGLQPRVIVQTARAASTESSITEVSGDVGCGPGMSML